MSNDLLKQSIAELQDLVRCRCHPAYTDRGMHDPDCDCDSADAVQAVADRIEELEADLRKMALDYIAAEGQAAEAYQAQLAAEAKLAKYDALMHAGFAEYKRRLIKAVEALELADAALSGANMNMSVVERKVKATIAELEGERDD